MRQKSSLDDLASKPTKAPKPKQQVMPEDNDMAEPVYKKPMKGGKMKSKAKGKAKAKKKGGKY